MVTLVPSCRERRWQDFQKGVELPWQSSVFHYYCMLYSVGIEGLGMLGNRVRCPCLDPPARGLRVESLSAEGRRTAREDVVLWRY